MRLSRRTLDAYNAAIKQQGDNAENAARKALNVWLSENPGASIADTREFCIALMNEVGTTFGNAAGDVAYAMRGTIADVAGVELPDVDYSYAPDSEFVDKTARYQVEKLKGGDSTGFVDSIADASRYFAERGANDTMTALGKADGKKLGRKVRFARVPTGATTCPYCCMLASRGFAYSSELSALNANHRHCDCRIVEGFEGMTVEGYDPNAFYRQWQKLDGIEKRDDLTREEKEVLKLVAADSEQEFSLEQSRDLAEKLDSIMKQRRDAFLEEITEDNYSKTIEALIGDIGKLYGMQISGEFLCGEKLYSAVPDGYEVWAATRMHDRWNEVQFLGSDRRRKKGNPDLLVNGEFIDIKTPESEERIARRINQGSTQCRNRGQENGIVLLSPLRLNSGFEKMEGIAQSRIDQGFADAVYVIGTNSTVKLLDKTSG